MTCQIGQGSLVSYFLRRDFFFTLCSVWLLLHNLLWKALADPRFVFSLPIKFITSSDSLEMQLEAQVLLGALANYHKFETRSKLP